MAVAAAKNNEKRHPPVNGGAQAPLEALLRYGECVLAWPWGERISRTTPPCRLDHAYGKAPITEFR